MSLKLNNSKKRYTLIQVTMLCLLMISCFLFIHGYDAHFPILGHDEGTFFLEALSRYGLAESVLPGYPPVIISTVDIAYQSLPNIDVDYQGLLGDETLARVRLIHVLINLINVALIFRITRELSNAETGIIAAFAWMLMPNIFKYTRQALSEVWIIVFMLLSIFFFLQALKHKQAFWAILSVLPALMAILAKYNAFPTLGFGILASLWFLWQDPNKKKWLITILAQGLIIFGGAFYTLFIVGAYNLIISDRPEASQFTSSSVDNLQDVDSIFSLFATAIENIQFNPLIFSVIIVFGSVVYLLKAKSTKRVAWIGTLIFCVSYTIFIVSFLNYSTTQDRYLTPVSSVYLILLTISIVTSISWLLSRWRIATIPILLVIFAWWLIPVSQLRMNQALDLERESTLVGIAEWSDVSLPAGTIATANNVWYAFDPIWGGYTGTLRPNVGWRYWLDLSYQELRAAHIDYVQLIGDFPGNMPDTLVDADLLYLKSFPIPDSENDWVGMPLHIYRLWEIETDNLNLQFDDGIVLRGYDLPTSELRPGEALTWTPYWQISSTPTQDYQVFLHLILLDDDQPVAQSDAPPVTINRPTTTWTDPYETLIGNTFTITIPDTLSEGNYQLVMGLYRLDDFQRLALLNGQSSFIIDTINIVSE